MKRDEGLMLVTFSKTNASGAYGVCPADGKNIYLHRDADIKPLPGDTYLCRVETPMVICPTNYFAIPIQKMDLNAFMGMSEGNRKQVAEYYGRTHPELFGAQKPVQETEVAEAPEEKMQELDVKDKFVYLGNDTLASSYLTKSRYEVFRSYDGRHMAIIQNSEGEVECRGGRMVLSGLDSLMEGDVGREIKPAILQGRYYLTLA